jgi:hypothetical protein
MPVSATLSTLLARMTLARDRLFPEQIRERDDGTRYFACHHAGCTREATAPALACMAHLERESLERVARLEALSTPAGRARSRAEYRARSLAAADGRPDRWEHYLGRASTDLERQSAVDDVV